MKHINCSAQSQAPGNMTLRVGGSDERGRRWAVITKALVEAALSVTEHRYLFTLDFHPDGVYSYEYYLWVFLFAWQLGGCLRASHLSWVFSSSLFESHFYMFAALTPHWGLHPVPQYITTKPFLGTSSVGSSAVLKDSLSDTWWSVLRMCSVRRQRRNEPCSKPCSGTRNPFASFAFLTSLGGVWRPVPSVLFAADCCSLLCVVFFLEAGLRNWACFLLSFHLKDLYLQGLVVEYNSLTSTFMLETKSFRLPPSPSDSTSGKTTLIHFSTWSYIAKKIMMPVPRLNETCSYYRKEAVCISEDLQRR